MGTNTVSDVNANQSRVIRCYNCKGEGHIAKQCTAKKRVKDVEWFKEKMLLAQAQEAGVILHEDQKDCLADRLEEMDDYDDLQLHTTSNFKADHVDAYDSDCDDEATACAIFMASLSPAGSINGDTAGPSYDSELLSEVPHYDTYHEDTILNDVVQEMEYNDHVVFNDNSCDELMSNSNVISYADY
ncbi:retrovirus-related pol polyprotein from transposon TNT 1-94, partial [Tanacetum coccineum]